MLAEDRLGRDVVQPGVCFQPVEIQLVLGDPQREADGTARVSAALVEEETQ